MDIRDMKKPHFVYLLQGVGTKYFKIGLARNVARRKRQYSLPFDLVIVKTFLARNYWDALDLEKRIQKLYRNHRCRGEWFLSLHPEHFISDLEWLSLKEYQRIEKEYLARGESYGEKPKEIPEVAPSKDTDYQDRIVLQTLREEGIEAAQKVREDFRNA